MYTSPVFWCGQYYLAHVTNCQSLEKVVLNLLKVTFTTKQLILKPILTPTYKESSGIFHVLLVFSVKEFVSLKKLKKSGKYQL